MAPGVLSGCGDGKALELDLPNARGEDVGDDDVKGCFSMRLWGEAFAR